MSAFKTFLCLFLPFCSCQFNNFSCPTRAFPLLLNYLSPVIGFSVFNLFVYFPNFWCCIVQRRKKKLVKYICSLRFVMDNGTVAVERIKKINY